MKQFLPRGRLFALSAGILILVAPSPAQSSLFRTYGKTCGPLLTGEARFDGRGTRFLDLSTVNAGANQVGALGLGVQFVSGTIPGGCALHHLPVALLPIVFDGTGTARARFATPANAPLGLTYAQVFDFDAATMKILSSNGLAIGPFVGMQTLDEDFKTRTQVDPDFDGAIWGGGKVVPAVLGGSGILGAFAATDGRDTQTKDAIGRDIYEFDVDSITVPATRTLSGTPIRVTNGVLEYASLIVGPTEHVRFVGTKPVVLQVAGQVRIDGVLALDVPQNTAPIGKHRSGQSARLGGAAGGDGGHRPGRGPIDGQKGGDVVLPRGHPRAAMAVGTGGPGSLANPRSGLDKDIPWIVLSGFKIFVRAMAAGGGGGECFGGGTAYRATGGMVFKVQKGPTPILGPFAPAEFGMPSSAGSLFPVLPEIANRSSLETFLIGGAGGGGAATHAAYSPSPTAISWSEGGGGAAGGGALCIRSGGEIAIGGTVRARGGDGAAYVNNTGVGPAPSPGGAGSGGSILLQTAKTAAAPGVIDTRGGSKGTFGETSALIEMGVESGRGGAGYYRVEAAASLPKLKDFAGALPVVTAANLASLRATDHASASGVASRWYRLSGTSRPNLESYVVDAVVDGNPVQYGDASAALRRAREGEAVVASFQRAVLDSSGQVVGSPSSWAMGSVRPLNDNALRGTGLRFFLRLDKSRTTTGKIEISRIRITHGN